MITAEQANEIQARSEQFEAWLNGRTSYRAEEIPADVPQVSNSERSALEVFLFVANPPEKYFLYISEEKREATTWTGDTLGSVSFGAEYRDNFGGKRVPVTLHAVNGRTYAGTYYKSSGNYARVKLRAKGKKA